MTLAVVRGVGFGLVEALPFQIDNLPTPYAYYYHGGNTEESLLRHLYDDGLGMDQSLTTATNNDYYYHQQETENDDDDCDDDRNYDLTLDQQYDILRDANHIINSSSNYDHSSYGSMHHDQDDYSYDHHHYTMSSGLRNGHSPTATTDKDDGTWPSRDTLMNSLLNIYEEIYFRLGGNLQSLNDYLLQWVATEEQHTPVPVASGGVPSARISFNRAGYGHGNGQKRPSRRSNLICLDVYASWHHHSHLCLNIFNGLAVVAFVFLLQMTLTSAFKSACPGVVMGDGASSKRPFLSSTDNGTSVEVRVTNPISIVNTIADRGGRRPPPPPPGPPCPPGPGGRGELGCGGGPGDNNGNGDNNNGNNGNGNNGRLSERRIPSAGEGGGERERGGESVVGSGGGGVGDTINTSVDRWTVQRDGEETTTTTTTTTTATTSTTTTTTTATTSTTPPDHHHHDILRQLLVKMHRGLVTEQPRSLTDEEEEARWLNNLSWLTEGWTNWLQGSFGRLGSLTLGKPTSAGSTRGTLCHMAGKLLH